MKQNRNNKGFVALIVPIVIIVLLSTSLAYSFYYNKFQINDSINKNTPIAEPKLEAKVTKNLEYKKYQADYTYGNISFEYPETYPINTEMFASFDTPIIDIGIFDINIDLNERNISSDELKRYYSGLTNGNFIGKSPFSLWSNDQVQIRKTKLGKSFGVSTTYAAYDLCTIRFHTDISIPQNNKIIEVSIFGDTDNILTSLKSSNVNAPRILNDDRCFTEDGGINKLSELLLKGQGTPEVRDWYNAANHVIDTLNY